MGRVRRLEGDGHEAEPFHGRTDYWDFAGAGSRDEDGRCVREQGISSDTSRPPCRMWRALGADRTSIRYRTRPDDTAVRARLRELAAIRRRFGYRRLHIFLTREGIVMNHTRSSAGTTASLKVRRRGAQSRARHQGTDSAAARPQSVLEPGLPVGCIL
jgi:hypothetical protein